MPDRRRDHCLHIGLLGEGVACALWQRALANTEGVTVEHVPSVPRPHDAQDLAALTDLLDRADALFVGGASGERFALAEIAVKRAVPLLLDWPPTTSLDECAAAVKLAEEAGVEIGVSRPLRFCPDLLDLPRAPNLVAIRLPLPAPPVAWRTALADAVDLAAHLAGRTSARGVESEAVRSSDGVWLEALGATLRFPGTLAQLTLARDTEPEVMLAGPGFRRTVRLPADAEAIPEAWRAAEAVAFVEALRIRRTPPVPLREGLRVMRTVERLVQRAR